ncbi:MAG: cation transporter [Lentisphaerae bacterium]|nr:cation transporter [Lentisphaerota bacterium]
MQPQGKKVAVAWLSVLSNTTLVGLKVLVGLMIGSVAIISEAIHSGIDLVASIVALFAVRESGKPADSTHPFGHGKIESISGFFEALLIFLAAGWILFEAVHKLIVPTAIEQVSLGIVVMLVSSVVNLIVSRLLFRVGRETHSIALQADAWHLRTDVYTSAGVMGGLVLMWFGEEIFVGVHFHWIDPVAAIAVALLILQAATTLTKQSLHDLLDTVLPPEEEGWIRERIVKYCPAVRGFHNLRTRRTGPIRFIDFHLLVDGDTTVRRSHELADELEDDIEAKFEGSSVTIHIEPCSNRCTPRCLGGCLRPPEEYVLRRPLGHNHPHTAPEGT